MINVVCAYIEINKNILIAKRASGDFSVINKWEFPGGKVEPLETEEHAIEREMMEEFSVNVKATEFIGSVNHSYPNKEVCLKLYRCEYIDGEFTIHDDHGDFTWISKEDLLNYDLAAADKELVEKYIN